MNLDDALDAIASILNDQSRAELFRRRRVRLLTSTESPLPLATGCQVFLHIVPTKREILIDYRDRGSMAVLYRLGNFSDTTQQGFNFDGFRRFAMEGGKISANLQCFRSGVIESCKVYPANAEGTPPRNYVPSQLLHAFLIHSTVEYIQALQEIGFQTPFLIFVTMIGVKGWFMATQSPKLVPIDRNELWPDHAIYNGSHAIDESIRTILDTLWNSSGLPQAPQY